MTLTELAQNFQTDKKSISSPSYASYLSVYGELFGPIQFNEINLLEIGVRGGESIRLWREYFPNGRIFGLDIDPSTYFAADRIEIIIGDQSKDFNRVLEKSGKLDVIIDDGSHINELTLASFAGFWPHLKSGGIYIIEDLGQSYGLTLSDVFGKWPGMEHNERRDYANNRADLNGFFNNHIEDMDKVRSEIKKIEFWPRIAVLHKL